LIKSRHYEQVARVPLEVGAQVKASQLLLRFTDDQERVELERARASLEKARTDYERTRRLHEDQGVSDSLLDEAETDLRLAEADAELAEIRLKELSIHAPFDGIIAERHVDPGASVEVGDILLRVTAITPLHVQALLPEAMLPRLADLKEITVTMSSTGETLRIPYEPGPVVVDPGSGTFLLQLEVDNGDHHLVPGVTCRVTLGGPSQ
jgi:membrane fusion protein (multidrug efflux system)